MTLAAGPLAPEGRPSVYRPGERLLGDYVIQYPLGANDVGDAYLVEDSQGRQRVARLLTADSELVRKTFERMKGRPARHLVDVVDLFQSPSGESWLVREYATGRSLGDTLIERNHGMRLKEALRWAQGIAAGLQELEEAGLVHGRLKPSNVRLEHGVIKLADYGLVFAKPRGGEEHLPTSRYTAPETLARRFDKADLYALGALLVEMLSGRAFDPTGNWLAGLAEPYAAILAKAVDPQPAQRYNNICELLQELLTAPVLRSPPVTPPPVEPRSITPSLRFAYAASDRPLPGLAILRPVGRGASGEVYQAVSDSGKTLALKLLQRNWEIELRGLRDCLRLPRHPNLLDLHDVRQSAAGDWWVVMDYADGPSLAETLDGTQGPLSPRLAAEWMQGVLAGLAHLHDAGIVHRDLKPRNILRQNGVVKIADYGLAKVMSQSRRTGHTETVGTLCYTAPEVARGRYGREIDIYACGVMLFEMLTGSVPFDGESAAEVLYKHLLEQPDLEKVPHAWRGIVAKALAKNPQERFVSAKAMAAGLEQVVLRPQFVNPTVGTAIRTHRFGEDAFAGVALIAFLATVVFSLSLMQSATFTSSAEWPSPPMAALLNGNGRFWTVYPKGAAAASRASSIWRPSSGFVI